MSGAVKHIGDRITIFFDQFQLDPVFALFKAFKIHRLPAIKSKTLTIDGGANFPIIVDIFGFVQILG